MNHEDVHFIAKKRKYIKRRRNRRIAVLVLLCTAILVVWAVIISLASNIFGEEKAVTTALNESEQVTAQTSEVVSEKSSFYGNAQTLSLEIPQSSAFEGTLTLVSDHLGYGIPSKKPMLTTIWGNKSQTYRVASSMLSLANEAFLAADKMFCDYNNETSNGDYQITMAYSGDSPMCCTEHGTGYAFDVNVYTNSGMSMRLVEAGGIYNWIYENCAKYGFVLRYGKDKTAVTGMAYDADHFRYVGVGHAEYMSERGMALEDYIGEVQKHIYGEKHLEFSYGGVDYEVFYVNLPTDVASAEIEIPADVSYTVSGDNIGGVIVTLYKQSNSAN